MKRHKNQQKCHENAKEITKDRKYNDCGFCGLPLLFNTDAPRKKMPATTGKKADTLLECHKTN